MLKYLFCDNIENSLKMKKFLIKGLIAGLLLLAINFAGLFITINCFPFLAEQYFSPVFDMTGYKGVLYVLHPFIISFALAWFWRRFKELFQGPFWLRGLEVGLVYGVVAVLPSMWIIFSAFDVSVSIVFSWFFYGILQGVVVGIIYAKISP